LKAPQKWLPQLQKWKNRARKAFYYL
jgi:hypothetical protein